MRSFDKSSEAIATLPDISFNRYAKEWLHMAVNQNKSVTFVYGNE